MGGTKRQYSDEDKAAALTALDLNDGNVYRTARELGIPRQTLQEWRDGRVNSEVPEIQQRKKGELAEQLRDVAFKLVAAINSKIGDATLQQTATALGIVVDKMQLLQGEPTDRTEVIDGLSDDERAARIASILDRARARRAGQSPQE